jgi:outer membrane protein OmpA-like peptidoglycan-associated protein
MLVLACACAGSAPGADPTPTATSGAVPGSVTTDAGPCTPGPGKHVTTLPDVIIPPVDVPELRVDDVELSGETIPGFVVPGIHIPEHTVDGGCLIRDDAAGGCLGAVEIAGDIDLPSLEIPGFTIPTHDAGGAHVDAVSVPRSRARGGHARGARADQVCQRRPDGGGGYVDSVYRDSIYRDSAYRDAIYRNGATRQAICIDGHCTDAVTVPDVSIPSVSVDSASIDSEHIDAQALPGVPAQVYEQDSQTAYIAPADVLFDFDRSDLRADARTALQAIVGDLTVRTPNAAITVEGHTDDVGDDAYNQRLSEQRADAVATWLISDGGINAHRITTTGHGETLPAAPNRHADGRDEPAGRAINRRVVITARS